MVKILSEQEKKKINASAKTTSSKTATKKSTSKKSTTSSKSKIQNKVAEKATKKKNEEKDLLEILLDMDNKENIILEDNNGKEAEFQQIAVIPMEFENETRLYAILKPVITIEGTSKEDVFVFMAYQMDEVTYLMPVTNEKEAEMVYDKYLDMVDEAKAKSNNK